VVHYVVTNMPAAVPHTSTQALCNATLSYILKVAGADVVDAMRQDSSLAGDLNIFNGQVTHPAVAEALGLPWQPME
jgi:alanine dehydrogenase